MAGPVEAVIDAITKPAVAGTVQRSGAGQAQAVLYRGGFGHQALADTFRVLRLRTDGGRAVVATEYDDVEGHHWLYFYGVELVGKDGWRVRGGGGGSGQSPVRPEPWINLAGWGWPSALALAGTLHGEGVARVRVIDRAGRVTEDLVEEGIVLLLATQRTEPPYRIELLDATNTVVGVQGWPSDSTR